MYVCYIYYPYVQNIHIYIVHIHIYLHICRRDNVCDTTILWKCLQPLYRRLACCQEASRPFLGVIFEASGEWGKIYSYRMA